MGSPLSFRIGRPLSLVRDVLQPLVLASPDIMGLSQAVTPGRGFTELVSLVAESGSCMGGVCGLFYLVISLELISSHVLSLCIKTKGEFIQLEKSI